MCFPLECSIWLFQGLLNPKWGGFKETLFWKVLLSKFSISFLSFFFPSFLVWGFPFVSFSLPFCVPLYSCLFQSSCSLLDSVELSGIMPEFCCYSWSWDRNSVDWLMYVINFHPLPGVDEVMGIWWELVKTTYVAVEGLLICVWMSLLDRPLHSFAFVLWHHLCDLGLDFLSFLFAAMLLDLKFLYPYYQVISQFFSGWLKSQVWRVLIYFEGVTLGWAVVLNQEIFLVLSHIELGLLKVSLMDTKLWLFQKESCTWAKLISTSIT